MFKDNSTGGRNSSLANVTRKIRSVDNDIEKQVSHEPERDRVSPGHTRDTKNKFQMA